MYGYFACTVPTVTKSLSSLYCFSPAFNFARTSTLQLPFASEAGIVAARLELIESPAFSLDGVVSVSEVFFPSAETNNRSAEFGGLMSRAETAGLPRSFTGKRLSKPLRRYPLYWRQVSLGTRRPACQPNTKTSRK